MQTFLHMHLYAFQGHAPQHEETDASDVALDAAGSQPFDSSGSGRAFEAKWSLSRSSRFPVFPVSSRFSSFSSFSWSQFHGISSGLCRELSLGNCEDNAWAQWAVRQLQLLPVEFCWEDQIANNKNVETLSSAIIGQNVWKLTKNCCNAACDNKTTLPAVRPWGL